jgi:cell division protein FtsB
MSARVHARSKRARRSKAPARAPRAFGPASDPEVAARFRAAAEAKQARPKPAKRPKALTKAKGPPKAKSAMGASPAKGPKSTSDQHAKAAGSKNRPRRFWGRQAPAVKAGKERSPSLSPRAQTTALSHRRRIPIALAGLFAVVVLATSFPLVALMSQHHQLSAAAAELHGLQKTNRSLAEQQRQLNSNAAIERLARADYQLVSPGQTLYDVLPASGRPVATLAGAPTAGDPGTQPLVAPANAPDMSPDPSLTQLSALAGSSSSGSKVGSLGSRAGGTSAAATGGAPSPTSFWSRVTSSLEFWK